MSTAWLFYEHICQQVHIGRNKKTGSISTSFHVQGSPSKTRGSDQPLYMNLE